MESGSMEKLITELTFLPLAIAQAAAYLNPDSQDACAGAINNYSMMYLECQ